MKCPKCGFFGPDHLDTCKKCGKDLTAEKARLGLNRQRTMRVRDQQASASSAEEGLLTGPTAPSGSDRVPAAAPHTEPLLPPPVPPPTPSTGVGKRPPEPLSSPRHAPPAPAAEEPPISLDEGEDFGTSTEEEPFAAPESARPRNAETSLDDFEFPDFTKTEPPSQRTAPEDESFAGLSLPDTEKEEPNQPSGTAEDEGFSLGNMGAPELPPEEEVLSETAHPSSLDPGDRGAAKTRLLSAQEIEDILHNELPRTPERLGPKTAEKAKTQLLDEDQLSDILGELDNDPSKPR